LLNPERAQSALARGLISRLNAVQDALLSLAEGQRRTRPELLAKMALEGAAEQLHLLKMASAAEPFLKRHYAKVGAQIILIDRLVTAAAVLDDQGIQLPDEGLQLRLRRLATALSHWRQAVLERRWPQVSEGLYARVEVAGGPPMLLEMERVIGLVATAHGQNTSPEELKALPKTNAIVSDAFSNPAYIQFAVKGALAAFICYLIFTLTAYQAIYTSVITCIVCSLSTIGASVQKGILRFAGSAVGGVLGVITLTCIFPYVDSIGGFWIPFAAVTCLAAYVTFGTPALSYCGYQIGLAFYKCVFQGYGPYTELRVVRDRLIGILLGLIVFELINNWLWPVKALETARAKLASVCQTLGKLAGLPDDSASPTSRLTEAYGLRLQAYQHFRLIHELIESAKFELREPVRRKLEQTTSAAQRLLLYLLAIIQHRPDLRPEAVPEALRQASLRFRTKLADHLQIVAAAGKDGDHGPGQDLQVALTELEHTVSTQMGAVTDSNLIEQVHARFALYHQTAGIAIEMARLNAET
jgi:multidrug resistance protein MdtO